MQEGEKKPERKPKLAQEKSREQLLRGLKGQEEADGLEQKRGREGQRPPHDEEVGGALPERRVP